jgi:hypothetical protein
MKKLILLIILTFFLFFPLLCSNKFINNFGDIYRYYYPHKLLAKESIVKGIIPLWNPYIFTGCPFLAQIQTSIFYPLNLVFYLFPINLGFKLFYLLHFILLATFMYFLLSTITGDATAAFYGSIVFTFSSYTISYIPKGHVVMFSSYVWAIITIFFGYGMLHFSPLANKKNLIHSLLFIFSISILFLSGHTQMFYISILFLFLLFCSSLKISLLIWFILCTFAGLVLVALQLLPTAELTIFSQRASQWNLAVITSYSAKIESLLTLVLPNIYGNPFDKTYKDKDSVFFETMCFYIGLFPVIFALAGIYKSLQEKKYLWILTGIVFFLLSLGNNLVGYKIVYSILPGIKFFRAPARFFFATLLSTTVLSSLGWNFMFGETALRRLPKCYLLGIKLLLILVTFSMLYIWDKKFVSLIDENCIFPYSETAKYLQLQYCKEKYNYRILTDQTVPNSNKSMVYHLYNINGCEVLLLNKFINAVSGEDIRPTTIDLEVIDYNLRKISLFSGKYIISAKKLNLPKIFSSDDTFVYLNSYAMPIIFSKQYTNKGTPSKGYILPAKIVQKNVNQICFLFPSPIQNITISIPYYPGHELFINKKKLKIYQTLTGMYSEITSSRDGKTEGILNLSSPTFTIGLYISLLTLGFALATIRNLI